MSEEREINKATSNETTRNTIVLAAAIAFENVLRMLKEGASNVKATRAGWNGAGLYIAFQRPDKDSKMSLPYFYMRTAQGDFVPWTISQTDLVKEDWIVYITAGL
jgi:hypothetical protein